MLLIGLGLRRSTAGRGGRCGGGRALPAPAAPDRVGRRSKGSRDWSCSRTPRPGENAPEFSVSEISGAVRRVLEGEFGRVRVRGEVGRVSRPSSGHVYFDLKDDRACLGALVWRSGVRGLAVQPQEGMEVVATGRLTTHAGQSKYQMVVEALAPAGVGALMAMLEARKEGAGGRGAVRGGAQAGAAVSARGDRGRDLAVGGGDPRHPAPPERAVSAAGAALAGDGAGAERARRRWRRRSAGSTRSRRAGRCRGRT